MVFNKTLEQTSILLIFIFIGYFLRKKEIINEGGKKVLAGLLVNLFLPCYYIVSLSTNLTIDKINQYLLYFVCGIGLAIAIVFIAMPFARLLGKNKLQRNVLKYSFAFANIGYFGYPVVGVVFGEAVKASMILFCIPQSIVISTYGYQILTQKPLENPNDVENALVQKEKWTKHLRFLYAPPFMGLMIGVVIGLLPINLPTYVVNMLDLAKNCQSPVAMLLTGAVLSSVPLFKLFASIKSYVVGFIRLIVVPVVIGLAFYLLGARGELLVIAVASVALPVGMNVVVYPESAGLDGTEGAKTCFISYVLALGTLPLVFEIIQMLAKM